MDVVARASRPKSAPGYGRPSPAALGKLDTLVPAYADAATIH
jgi:hypothetical protein